MVERRLVLVRHAKSVQDGGVDRHRPLAARGRADAAAVGRWLADHDVVPDRVVVSPALRARETWERTGFAVEPEVDERVYDNTVDALLAVIRATPDDVPTLVLVGHNPSFGALAASLDESQPVDEFPTSAVAVFAVDGAWGGVGAGTTTRTALAAPRG